MDSHYVFNVQEYPHEKAYFSDPTVIWETAQRTWVTSRSEESRSAFVQPAGVRFSPVQAPPAVLRRLPDV